MIRYVALLRAINVGGHNVKMVELRDIFSALKLADVATFIASGNVRFASKVTDVTDLESRIQTRLQKALGYAVETFIRTSNEIVATVDGVPAAPERLAESPRLSIGFLKAALTADQHARVLALAGDDNDFVFRGRDFYWWTAGRFSDSTITGAKLERALGQPTTIRNVTTVRKLALLCLENA